jgi:hypothetical protein
MYMPQGGSSKLAAWLLTGILGLVVLCSLVTSLGEGEAALVPAVRPSGAVQPAATPTVVPDTARTTQTTGTLDTEETSAVLLGIIILAVAAGLSILILVAALSVLKTQAERRAAEEAAAARLVEQRKLLVEQTRQIEARADLLAAERQARLERAPLDREEPMRVRARARTPAQASQSNRPARMARPAPAAGSDRYRWPPEEVDITDLPMAG